eukprot:GHVN01107097.1.p1 GENE.GHVN01107097.1~~GHVN01107097.1.p1  ORF type:complete len:881 (+),score=160.45 GHVN01107097.1:227-2869(+)
MSSFSRKALQAMAKASIERIHLKDLFHDLILRIAVCSLISTVPPSSVKMGMSDAFCADMFTTFNTYAPVQPMLSHAFVPERCHIVLHDFFRHSLYTQVGNGTEEERDGDFKCKATTAYARNSLVWGEVSFSLNEHKPRVTIWWSPSCRSVRGGDDAYAPPPSPCLSSVPVHQFTSNHKSLLSQSVINLTSHQNLIVQQKSGRRTLFFRQPLSSVRGSDGPQQYHRCLPVCMWIRPSYPPLEIDTQYFSPQQQHNPVKALPLDMLYLHTPTSPSEHTSQRASQQRQSRCRCHRLVDKKVYGERESSTNEWVRPATGKGSFWDDLMLRPITCSEAAAVTGNINTGYTGDLSQVNFSPPLRALDAGRVIRDLRLNCVNYGCRELKSDGGTDDAVKVFVAAPDPSLFTDYIKDECVKSNVFADLSLTDWLSRSSATSVDTTSISAMGVGDVSDEVEEGLNAEMIYALILTFSNLARPNHPEQRKLRSKVHCHSEGNHVDSGGGQRVKVAFQLLVVDTAVRDPRIEPLIPQLRSEPKSDLDSCVDSTDNTLLTVAPFGTDPRPYCISAARLILATSIRNSVSKEVWYRDTNKVFTHGFPSDPLSFLSVVSYTAGFREDFLSSTDVSLLPNLFIRQMKEGRQKSVRTSPLLTRQKDWIEIIDGMWQYFHRCPEQKGHYGSHTPQSSSQTPSSIITTSVSTRVQTTHLDGTLHHLLIAAKQDTPLKSTAAVCKRRERKRDTNCLCEVCQQRTTYVLWYLQVVHSRFMRSDISSPLRSPAITPLVGSTFVSRFMCFSNQPIRSTKDQEKFANKEMMDEVISELTSKLTELPVPYSPSLIHPDGLPQTHSLLNLLSFERASNQGDEPLSDAVLETPSITRTASLYGHSQ